MIADLMPTSAAELSRELLRRCCLDGEFKDRLLADPAAALREEGWEVPDGFEVQLLPNTLRARGLTLPSGLDVAEVPDALLGQVYGRTHSLLASHATRCNNTRRTACCSIGCLLPLPDLN